MAVIDFIRSIGLLLRRARGGRLGERERETLFAAGEIIRRMVENDRQ